MKDLIRKCVRIAALWCLIDRSGMANQCPSNYSTQRKELPEVLKNINEMCRLVREATKAPLITKRQSKLQRLR